MSDVFSAILACGFLGAFIRNPDSNWLAVVAVAILVWTAGGLIHAEQRAPTGSEWRRLIVTIALLTVGAIALGAIVITFIIRSARQP